MDAGLPNLQTYSMLDSIMDEIKLSGTFKRHAMQKSPDSIIGDMDISALAYSDEAETNYLNMLKKDRETLIDTMDIQSNTHLSSMDELDPHINQLSLDEVANDAKKILDIEFENVMNHSTEPIFTNPPTANDKMIINHIYGDSQQIVDEITKRNTTNSAHGNNTDKQVFRKLISKARLNAKNDYLNAMKRLKNAIENLSEITRGATVNQAELKDSKNQMKSSDIGNNAVDSNIQCDDVPKLPPRNLEPNEPNFNTNCDMDLSQTLFIKPPPLPQRNEQILPQQCSKTIPSNLLAVGMEKLRNVKSKYSKNKSSNGNQEVSDHTNVNSKLLAAVSPTLPPRNDQSTPIDSVHVWMDTIFSQYTEEFTENGTICINIELEHKLPINKSEVTFHNSEELPIKQSEEIYRNSEESLMKKTKESHNSENQMHSSSLDVSDFDMTNDFGLSESIDTSTNAPEKNSEDIHKQIDDQNFMDDYIDQYTHLISLPLKIELPEQDRISLFSSFGSDIAKFLDATSDDISPTRSVEIIQEISSLQPCLPELPERNRSQSDSDNHPLSPDGIEISSQSTIIEGPTILTTSLSTTSLNSNASTKNDEKGVNIIPNSAEIALTKKHIFVDIINDDNANFHSMLSFANSDAKKKDYKNALKSLKYVIENISLLDVNDRHVLGNKAMILLDRCANNNVDCATYIAHLYADGIHDLFEEDINKSLHYLLKGDRKNDAECVFHAAVILENIGSNKEVVHYITKAAKMYFII
jgi:hypothetical protein